MPAAVASPSSSGHASDQGDALELRELFAILRDKSPKLAAERAKVDVAKARFEGAKVYPNPIVNFQALQLLSGYNQNGFGTYTVFLQQPVLIAGQRVMRRKAAAAEQAKAEAEVERSFHELAAEGRRLFAALQGRQQHHAILERAVTDLERVRGVVETRHSVGAESRYDVVRIGLEVAKWRAKLPASSAEIHDAGGKIGVLVGRPRWRPLAAGTLASNGFDADPEALWPDVERAQPAIQAARRNESLASRELQLARREAMPTPTLGFGIVGIDNFFSMSALGGVTMPLPVFDWGQGPVAKAKAEVHVANLETKAVVAEAEAELERAVDVMRERRGALAQFERDVLAQTEGIQRMAEDSYVTGQASILELIDAIEIHYEVELEHIDLVEAVVQAEIDLLQVLGRIEEEP
ncbi:MAG: TolC family protein [Nannocystaceae bacterium]